MMATPKYQIVHDEIRNRLETGQYAIGMRMPTEGELSSTFGVSRITVRKALEMLVRAGFLTSRRGSGYSVATLSPPSSTCLVSFTDQVLIEGRVPGAKLLGIDTAVSQLPEPVAEYFEEDMARVERLRTVDGSPRMLTQTWVPMRLVPNIAARHFPETGQNQSILRILQQVFDLAWSSACESLDSLIADQDVADLLDIPSGTPILAQACTAFAGDGSAVFYDLVYRQGPIRFDLAGPAPRQIG